MFGCSSQESTETETKPTNIEKEITEPEPNTYEMVDSIMSKAREDAKTATDK